MLSFINKKEKEVNILALEKGNIIKVSGKLYSFERIKRGKKNMVIVDVISEKSYNLKIHDLFSTKLVVGKLKKEKKSLIEKEKVIEKNARRDGVNYETQEKLNIPVVKQRFIERKRKLENDYDHYIKTINRGAKFNNWVVGYYETIPLRILELEYILKNVV